MKKAFSYMLIAALVVALFASCATKVAPVVEAAPAVSPLTNAKNYLFMMYKDKPVSTTADYKVVDVVTIAGTQYPVTWTADTEYVTVEAGENHMAVVKVNTSTPEEVSYTLTATITDAEGNTESQSFAHTIPADTSLTGPQEITAPVVGEAYRYAFYQANLESFLYFKGEMSGKYLATTDVAAEAADIYFEEAEGGYYMYTGSADAKTYIEIYVNDEGKANVKLTAETPASVFVIDADANVPVTTIGTNSYYLGTYKTYNTMSVSSTTYILGNNLEKIGVSQFPGKVYEKKVTIEELTEAPADGDYHWTFNQANLETRLYFAGDTSGKYLATTDQLAKSVKVTVENVEGGFYMSFMKDDVKTYIEIYVNDEGKANVRLTADVPAVPFEWNADANVPTVTIGTNGYYLGTYKTYNTLSVSATTYILGSNLEKIGVSQFPAKLANIN